MTSAANLKVTIANGAILNSRFICKTCPYSIQGEQFGDNFRVLNLKGCDVILGVDWIYTHKLSICHYGQNTIFFRDDTLPKDNYIISVEKL